MTTLGDRQSTEAAAGDFSLTASEKEARAHLAGATIVVANCGPTVPSLIANLARLGVETIELVGDAPLSPLAIQQVRHFLPSDVDRLTSEVLASRLELERLGLRLQAHRDFPTSKLDWQERISGKALVVAPVVGPVLFLPWLEALNEAALDAGTPWITCAMPSASEIFVGPTFVPGVTACYKCYELRYKSHIPSYDAYLPFEAHLRAKGTPVDFGFLPPFADMAGSLVAMEVARALLPLTSPHTLGKLVTFDTSSFAKETHPLLPLPRCLSCSPTRNAPASREWR
jgi:bacteriocin biosynthesis cyclodehydratase domain-containing protein